MIIIPVVTIRPGLKSPWAICTHTGNERHFSWDSDILQDNAQNSRDVTMSYRQFNEKQENWDGWPVVLSVLKFNLVRQLLKPFSALVHTFSIQSIFQIIRSSEYKSYQSKNTSWRWKNIWDQEHRSPNSAPKYPFPIRGCIRKYAKNVHSDICTVRLFRLFILTNFRRSVGNRLEGKLLNQDINRYKVTSLWI